MTELRNARVLVTGAASGIGREMALIAAERGARIVAWDVDAAGLDQLRADLAERGAEVRTDVVDVTDRAQVEELLIIGELVERAREAGQGVSEVAFDGGGGQFLAGPDRLGLVMVWHRSPLQ